MVALGFIGVARAEEKLDKILYLGSGVFSENMAAYSVNPANNTTSPTATAYFNLSLMGRLSLSRFLTLSSAIGYTPLARKSPEGSESSSLFTSVVLISWVLAPLDFKLGPGFLHKT